MDTARAFKELKVDVIPGQKLCTSCRVEIREKNTAQQADTTSSESDRELRSKAAKEILHQYLDSSLGAIDVSPVKVHAVASHSKVSYGKRKIQQVQQKLEEQQAAIQEKVAKVIDIAPELEALINPVEQLTENLTELKQNAKDLDTLVDLMKEKLIESNRKRKIQILTIDRSSIMVDSKSE